MQQRSKNQGCSSAEKRGASASHYAVFFDRFRGTDLCFLPCRRELNAHEMHAQLVEGLLTIGEQGIAEGLGAAMHLYMLASFALAPVNDAAVQTRREEFLRLVEGSRFLIANTGSDAQTRSANAGRSSTVVESADGVSVINGAKTFLSLAEVADLLVFTAQVRDGTLAFFVAPLRDPAIQIGAAHFDAAFPLHTHSVVFRDLRIPDRMAFLPNSGQGDALPGLHAFQRALFQSLISAVYLGAARRALAEAVAFAREAGLATLDGVHVELGRLLIQWHGALAPTKVCGPALARFVECPDERALQSFSEVAMVAKQVGCAAATEIVTGVQRFIGTRAMEPGHVLAEISRLTPFGPLHPVVAAQAQRQFGRALLSLST